MILCIFFLITCILYTLRWKSNVIILESYLIFDRNQQHVVISLNHVHKTILGTQSEALRSTDKDFGRRGPMLPSSENQ